MDVKGSVALVTGANRGIGRHFVHQLVERGAATVYATARKPENINIPGVKVLPLDITDPESVVAAATAAPDVTLLINNAGTTLRQNVIDGDLDKIRQELDTHLWGTLRMIRAFGPVLGRNGGGAILNVLSVLSWFSSGAANSYSIAKAAEWALTNSARIELAGQGTLVTGLHMAAVDTDAMAGHDVDKLDPADVARAALDGIEARALEVLLDEPTRYLKAGLSGDVRALYPSAA
ncbi:SDR family oxidoreductase [Dactylosporangium sp. NPDC048998]|uniref:SDR family oxidoreductase n=1 Tax=Dactylosporangium sp. NPDC048998 TaxID=3363976 RepID=UPI003716D62B